MNTKLRYKIPVIIAIILSVYTTSRAAGLTLATPNKIDFPGRMQARKMNAAEPLVLTDGQVEYPLGLHMELLEDPGGGLTITDVSSPEYDPQFSLSEVAVPNYGYTESIYWVRVRLDNQTQHTNEWLLEVGFSNTQYVDLYTPLPDGAGFNMKPTGVLRPIDTRDVIYPNIVFSLNIPAQSQQTYYLRFQNGASMTIPLTLWTKNAFIAESGQVLILHWLLFGGFLALLVYHLFLLLTLREINYLFFVFLLASMLAVLLEYLGYMVVYISPSLYAFKPLYFPLFISLMYSSIILFSDNFLELRTRFPKFHRMNIGLLAVWGVLTLMIPFTSYLNMARLMAPMQLVTISATFVIGIVVWRKDFRRVRFFMIAWLGMAASLMLLSLVRLGIAPSSFFNENIFQLGFVVMAVAWSFALADRINLLTVETVNANREIQSSEHRLSQILESMPLGVVLYGKDQKPKYFNQRTVEILNYPAMGIRPDLSAGRDLGQAIDHFAFKVAGSGEKYPLEAIPVYRALQGHQASVDDIELDWGNERRSMEMWARPILDEAGNVESAVAAFQDITLRRQVEAELDEHRRQLESLVEKRTAGLNNINKELRQRLEWFAAMNFVSQIVAQTADLNEINEKIVEILNNLLTTQDSFIAELDMHNLQLTILAHSCHSDLHPVLKGSFMVLPEGIMPGSSQEEKTFFFLSPDQINSLNGIIGIHIQDSKVQSIALVPLRLRDQILGFLGLEMCDVDRVFSEEESSLVNIFSTRIAQLIESARLFELTKVLVAQEERDRLARELHDSVTQALFSANLVAEVLPQIWRRDPDRALQSLEKLQRLMRGALAEMRTVLLELRPSAVINTPLGELLAQLTESVTSRSGLPFQLFIEKIPLLTEEVQISFFRIAQEALNNVVKHAQARLVTVRLSETLLPPEENRPTSREVRLLIQDDGVGFPINNEQSGHLGINIMRERASAIQAVLSLESEPGHGTRVSLIWRKEFTSESDHE